MMKIVIGPDQQVPLTSRRAQLPRSIIRASVRNGSEEENASITAGVLSVDALSTKSHGPLLGCVDARENRACDAAARRGSTCRLPGVCWLIEWLRCNPTSSNRAHQREARAFERPYEQHPFSSCRVRSVPRRSGERPLLWSSSIRVILKSSNRKIFVLLQALPPLSRALRG
jgi:hypothetical protein